MPAGRRAVQKRCSLLRRCVRQAGPASRSFASGVRCVLHSESLHRQRLRYHRERMRGDDAVLRVRAGGVPMQLGPADGRLLMR